MGFEDSDVGHKLLRILDLLEEFNQSPGPGKQESQHRD